jgi:catalase
MATRKTPDPPGQDPAAASTDSGPAGARPDAGLPSRQAAGTDALARRFPHNVIKADEYAADGAGMPPEGPSAEPDMPAVLASTLSEVNTNAKAGERARDGENPTVQPLNRVRADDGGRAITTNLGVPVADNQNSLKAGRRGPALLKDFILRDKITHFDHERIPERIVHARGSGAHGYFECTRGLASITQADLLQEPGRRTPVFVRFSTVVGERGSKDTARDARGFAVKFYTREGNWDLVGNNMPVFFIQDAMKFPDLVHSIKPEPHHGMPQAAAAHDTFWDFVSLMPESTHMLMWVMSDRAIPRSYRMMQGFGVHTFRLVNADGTGTLVKFHWTPKQGVHSLLWDEAVKISGADPDYHRRDLWEAIEAGDYPEWELGLQVFTDEQAEAFSFDVLDPTKIVPEELVAVVPVGRLVLNRNPDNFFAETEQVAFCAAHVVPGIDFTNDPLLAGRIHSYVDTQISRLGWPNFHEIPINTPVCPVHNNQRDGMHRQAIHRGRVSYEPNSLGGGCPFQAGSAGFVSFPEPVDGEELRGKPERFAEHYQQARLFYESQSAVEQRHIQAAFRFELSKVTVPAIRERTVAMLRNASEELAQAVADGLGIELPEPMPCVLDSAPEPEVRQSPRLSQFSMPGEGGIRSRRIAVLVADGVDAATADGFREALVAEGAVVRLLGPRVGPFVGADGGNVDAGASLENEASALFDAVLVPGGHGAMDVLAADGRALEFLRDQYRHCKPLCAVGAGARLLEAAGLGQLLEGPGMLVAPAFNRGLVADFVAQIGEHRVFERETDPPAV